MLENKSKLEFDGNPKSISLEKQIQLYCFSLTCCSIQHCVSAQQLCICTIFHHGKMVTASLFLACKVENQPRAMDEIIKIQHRCLNPGQPSLITNMRGAIKKFPKFEFCA
jgi:hypothetical protein